MSLGTEGKSSWIPGLPRSSYVSMTLLLIQVEVYSPVKHEVLCNVNNVNKELSKLLVHGKYSKNVGYYCFVVDTKVK